MHHHSPDLSFSILPLILGKLLLAKASSKNLPLKTTRPTKLKYHYKLIHTKLFDSIPATIGSSVRNNDCVECSETYASKPIPSFTNTIQTRYPWNGMNFN